jgi:membrane-associated phospholipid phosphatase
MPTTDATSRPDSRVIAARRWRSLAAAWLVLFLVALSLDRTIATAVHDSQLESAIRGSSLATVLKEPGEYRFTAAVAIVGLLARQLTPPQTLFIALAGVVSGINGLIKWVVGRTRPFKLPGFDDAQPFHLEPFWHGIKGFWHQKDLCFPSGHATTAFALAAAVTMVRPRWGWLFIPLAILVGAERVLENAHYLSDVVGGAGLGAAGAWLVYVVLQRWFELKQPEPPAFPVIHPPPAEPATSINP